MEGQSRESLEIALKDWKDRKFTSKTPLPLSRKERRKEEAVKEKPVQEEQIKKEPVEEKISDEEPIKKVSTEEKLFNEEPIYEEHNNKENLVEVSEFEKRFPRISKFLPKFFKKSRIATSIANWGKNNKNEYKEEVEPEEVLKKDLDKEPDEIHKTDTEEKLEKKENKEQNYEDKKQKFRDYVKYNIDILEVADKGIDQIDAERRKQKLENAKKQAYERDAKKYGYDNPKKDEGR